MAYLIVGINTMLIVIFFVTAEKALEYKQAAVKMLASLSSDKYQCGKSKPAFLLHSTGHLPAGSEIVASIIYADYYSSMTGLFSVSLFRRRSASI